MTLGLLRRTLWASVGVALLGCGAITDPTFPQGTPTPTTDQYRAWWSQMEACSGLTRSIDGVSFYLADSLPNQVVGHWEKIGTQQRIYLVRFYAQSPIVLKHEIMHALVQHTGHPPEYFHGRCGDLTGAD